MINYAKSLHIDLVSLSFIVEIDYINSMKRWFDKIKANYLFNLGSVNLEKAAGFHLPSSVKSSMSGQIIEKILPLKIRCFSMIFKNQIYQIKVKLRI